MRDDDFDRTLAAGSDAMAETIRPRPAEAVRARGDQRRRRQAAGIALAAVVLVAGGGAAAYGGTRGSTPPPPATRVVTPTPAPSSTSPKPSSPPPSPATSSSAPAATAPASTAPATSPPPSSAPATGAPWQFGANIPDGPYADGTNEVPHYTLSVTRSGTATFSGAITFVFQDGRTESGGTYRATLLAGGQLTFVLSTGQTLAGTYEGVSFILGNCGTALKEATAPDLCTFSYQPGATS
jgi:hypothetical protein